MNLRCFPSRVGRLLPLIVAAFLSLMIAGCNFSNVATTPTALADLPSPTPTITAAPTVLLPTPSLTPTFVAALETPTITPTPLPPTASFTPSPTEGPYEYTIQQGDGLYYIIQLPPWNYRNYAVIDEILRINSNIPSVDRLPPPGSIILIPRPTATPTPSFDDQTATARAGGPPQISLPSNAEIIQVEIGEGETIIGIAQRNSTTLNILATLNPQLGWFGCDFRNPSGGPDCNVEIGVGEVVNVPELTSTPTLSPTFSGSETPTATHTYTPPTLLFPPPDAGVRGGSFQLQWLSAGVLNADQFYFVQIENTTTGAAHTDVTRNTSYPIPATLAPSGDTPNAMRWRVVVAQRNAEGSFAPIGGSAGWRAFTWQAG